MLSSPDSDGSTGLVRRIQEGDESAWEALYSRFRDRLLLYIRCKLGPALRSRLQSEDILHSVFREVIGGMKFEAAGEDSVSRFLHVCVLNKIRKKVAYFSAQKRSGGVALTDTMLDRVAAGGGGGIRYRDCERYEGLEAAISRLPANMKDVLFLRLFENQSNKEAARVLDKSAEAVSKLYNRALSRLGILMSRTGER